MRRRASRWKRRICWWRSSENRFSDLQKPLDAVKKQRHAHPYSFSSRIPPFEVERSSTGPPVPIVPSKLCLLICPCICTSKADVMEPFDVWARKRALMDGGIWTVIPALLVEA